MQLQSFHSRLREYLQPLVDLKRITVKAIVGFMLWGIMPIFGLLYTKYLIGILETGDREKFITHVWAVGASLVVYFIVRFIVKNWTRVHGYWAYKAAIYERVLPKVVAIDNNAYDTIGTGNLIHIVEKGCSMWAKNLTHLTRYSIEFSIALIVNMYFIAQLGWQAVVAFIVAMGVFGIIMYVSNKSMLFYRRKRKDADQKGTRRLVKLLMSKFDILQNDKTSYEIDGITQHEYEAIFWNKKMSVGTEFYFVLPMVLIYMCVTAVFYIGGQHVLTGELKLSEFYGIVGALFIFQGSVGSMLTFVKDFSRDYELTEKMMRFLRTYPSVQHLYDGAVCRHAEGDIVFNHVSFAYSDSIGVIDRCDLVFAGGKKTAMVGPSGSGKTTMIKLIAGYIHPTGGIITLGGQQLPGGTADHPVSLASLYSHIGYLTQEPNVFDGTVIENITYGCKKHPTKKQIQTALEAARCDFVDVLPQGRETEIGEKGIRLSGGQRQRLAIAKLILKDPAIILLDEPTSALDSESEEAVTAAMNTLFVGRTVVVVAHRLQTVKHADVIYYIEAGRVIEQGTHDELVSHGGKYAKMLELQSGF